MTELLRYAHVLTNNKETQRKNVWRSGGLAPLVLHLDIRWMYVVSFHTLASSS